MATDKIDETEDGYYVRQGDVLEWRWKDGKAPEVYGAVMVVAPEPEPAPKAAPKAEPKAESKTATKTATKGSK